MFGLSHATVKKAERMNRWGRIRIDHERPGSYYAFKVTQDDEGNCETYLRIDTRGIATWSCNASSGEWGCVFSSKDRSKPFCAHTLAAYMHLRNTHRMEYAENVFLDWQEATSIFGFGSKEAEKCWQSVNKAGRIQMLIRAGFTE